MSLLMDALKKAEEAKRQSEAAARIEPQAQPFSAEPPAEEAGPPGLPELPSRLELLDHQFHPAPDAKQEPAPGHKPAPRQPAEQRERATDQNAPAQQRERAAAKNVFEAKQPAPRRMFPFVVGGATLLALIAIGGYFWWELQPKGGLAAAPATARTSPAPTPIAAAPATPVTPLQAPPPATPAAVAPPPAAASPPKEEKAAAVPPALTSARPAAPKPAPAAAAPPESPIRITTGRPKVNPQVASAYQAFQAGDLAAARRDYEVALKNEPKNTDALHGLAAIGLRQGQPEAAEDYYLRILEADPKDSAAQAGLIGLRGAGDVVQSESRLKNLLAGQPESPTLNFALGNLYAREGRWNDAQQAYFRAYSADSDNPDYLFNLAVSLDQLRQPKLALQYYQGALAAATRRPAAFDRDQVAGRVSELQK